MPDKWDQYAAPAKPQADRWDQYATTTNTPPPPPQQPEPNAFDKAMQTEPITAEHPIKSTLNNLGAGAARVVFGNDPRGLISDLSSGNPAYSLGESLVKPFVQNPSGEAVAAIPQLLMAGLGGGESAASAGEGSARLLQKNPLPKQYRSPLIPPSEGYARAIVDQLGLPNPAREGAVSTLGQHGPLLRDYLRSQGAGTNPLEVAKGATNIGREGTGFYQEHLIEPNQMQETGEGPVGDVYGRVTKNNRLLAPDYRKGLTVETDAGLERKANLVDENRRLNRALYDTLSARSGISPEEVQSINKRGAEMQSLGDEAQNAQGLRAQGYKPGGTGHIPYSNLDKAMRLVNWFRGGEEAVRGKRIGSLLEQMPGEASSLPQPEKLQEFRNASSREDLGIQRNEMQRRQANAAAAQARKPAGMGPTTPPEATVLPPPKDYTQNFANRMRQRAVPTLPPPEPPQAPRSTGPMDKYLGPAREIQEQARTLRKGKKQ